ncbi:hypothetical protein GFM14_14640 [Rhizobium leguminosarum bv. viciae]|uniref:hypothetical protein n=1 Tax=Rhizobium leguminosarum TaxID=384 RepID=UPI001440E8D9|nr:hypothetical protein [Rhizobium leguminosarum]NKJ92821.1 hypothetical protein [Rhizobium leguminosarum bv. viciae]NKK86676.1 hypothetical protein [Rhizobium leguminosarum bv. viciae]
MRSTLLRTGSLTAAAVLLALSCNAAETACPQADANFVIRKTESWYALEYMGSQIHRIEPAQLDDLFGRKTPTTDCDEGLSSRDVMGIVVGWKKDLLIAFGILRDQQGRPVRVDMLSFSPHSGPFEEIGLNGQSEIVMRYGGLATRICWNDNWNQRWAFSNQQTNQVPEACGTTQGPFGASQYLIPIP